MKPASPYSLERIQACLNAGAEGAEVAAWRGDSRRHHHDRLREAAVLIPIMASDSSLSMLFTRRPANLRSHPNQISFPGGSRESVDDSLIATALREAEEEVGLPPKEVEILGYLDPYVTITGFHVQPIVGLIPGQFQPIPDPSEVAEAFFWPIERVLNTQLQRQHQCLINGSRASYCVIDVDLPPSNPPLWGATAGMLASFSERLIGMQR